MIITTATLITGALVWLGSELHTFNKGHAQAEAVLIQHQTEYCPPAHTLPRDMPDWQIQLHKQDCKGLHGYLEKKVPEPLMTAPTAPEVPAP